MSRANVFEYCIKGNDDSFLSIRWRIDSILIGCRWEVTWLLVIECIRGCEHWQDRDVSFWIESSYMMHNICHVVHILYGSHLMPKVSYMPYTMTEDHVSAFLIPVRVMFVPSHIIIATGEDKSIIHGRIVS